MRGARAGAARQCVRRRDAGARPARGKKTSLKAALLDQSVVAGLGNIYVCEALHRAHLSPKRSASTHRDRTGAPHARAERAGRCHQGGARTTPSRPAARRCATIASTDGELGYFQHTFRVYDREGEVSDAGCKGTIKRIVQGTR